MQHIYLVVWAFLSAFVMYCELLLLTCYEYEHRQKSLGMRFITSRQSLPSGHPLTYSIGWGRQLFVVQFQCS